LWESDQRLIIVNSRKQQTLDLIKTFKQTGRNTRELELQMIELLVNFLNLFTENLFLIRLIFNFNRQKKQKLETSFKKKNKKIIKINKWRRKRKIKKKLRRKMINKIKILRRDGFGKKKILNLTFC